MKIIHFAAFALASGSLVGCMGAQNTTQQGTLNAFAKPEDNHTTSLKDLVGNYQGSIRDVSLLDYLLKSDEKRKAEGWRKNSMGKVVPCFVTIEENADGMITSKLNFLTKRRLFSEQKSQTESVEWKDPWFYPNSSFSVQTGGLVQKSHHIDLNPEDPRLIKSYSVTIDNRLNSTEVTCDNLEKTN